MHILEIDPKNHAIPPTSNFSMLFPMKQGEMIPQMIPQIIS